MKRESRPSAGTGSLQDVAGSGRTPIVRRSSDRTPPRHALGTAYAVVGTRGRRRLVVLTCCPYCDEQHQHSAPLDFTAGRRTAACHNGRYLLHLAAVEGRVVA